MHLGHQGAVQALKLVQVLHLIRLVLEASAVVCHFQDELSFDMAVFGNITSGFRRQQIELLGGLLELVPLVNVDHGDGYGCVVVE